MTGVGRLLAVVYTVFAVAAGARAAFQLATKFHHAPLAYLLSAVAAVIYIVAARCFHRPSEGSWRTAVLLLGIELLGVVGVGVLTLARGDLFADQTVWSDFGSGYGFIPLVLPIVGLAWLLRGGTRSAFARGGGPGVRETGDPG